MPDLRNRTEYEQQVNRAINGVLRNYRTGRKEYDPQGFEEELERTLTEELTDVHREAIIVLLLLWMQSDSVPLDAVRRFDSLPREQAKAVAGSVRRTTTDRLRRSEAKAEGIVRKVIDNPKMDDTEQSRQLAKAKREARKVLKTTRADVFGPGRSESIAVTSVTTASSRAERAASQILTTTGTVVKAYWVTERDSKVCPICRPLHNEPEENWRFQFPDGPSAHPNCVLAETPVCGASIVSASHVQYQGPVVTFHLGDGSSFRVTANHMLLTRQGFVRAIDIMQGDDLISTSLIKSDGLVSFDRPHDNWEPPLAENVFHSLSVTSGVASSSVPVATEYLHGDAAFGQSDIDVVWADSFLRDEFNSSISQPLDHLGFVFRGDGTRGFSSSRSLAQFLMRAGHATDGGVSVLRESKAIFLGQSRHSQFVGLAAGSDGQAEFFKPAVDGESPDAKILADLQNAFASVVSTTQVVKVDVCTPHEPVPVYDFETNETTYIVGNGIVGSNCRCWLRWETV